jgi:hypothetical protein
MGRPFKARPVENAAENVENSTITSNDIVNTKPMPVPTDPQLLSPIPGLPDKPTFRVSEVAAYFDVSERTVYLWIEHAHLSIEYTPAGQKRIPRESINKCRFKPRNHVNNLPQP